MSERKIIIFLGAGASKADDAPLQAELLHKFFSYEPSEYSSLYSTLEGFFKKFFFGDREMKNIQLEEYPT